MVKKQKKKTLYICACPSRRLRELYWEKTISSDVLCSEVAEKWQGDHQGTTIFSKPVKVSRMVSKDKQVSDVLQL